MAISLLVSALIGAVYRIMIKPEDMRAAKREMEEIRKRVKEAQKAGNEAKVRELMSEQLKISQKQMSLNFRVMPVSLIVFIIAVWVFGTFYNDVVVRLPFQMPLPTRLAGFPPVWIAVKNYMGWFLWYICVTIPGTIFFRKLFGAE